RPRSSYRGKPSKSVPLLSEELRTAHLHLAIAIHFPQAFQKVRHFCSLGSNRQKASDRPLPFCDLNRFPLVQQIFDHGKPVTKVAHRGLPHVMHYSITSLFSDIRSRQDSRDSLQVRL